MTDRRHATGRRGEDLAARYLEKEGLKVVQRNYRCALGEIDLVAEGAEGLVFVEVRTKSQPCLVRPEETITRPKAHRLVRLAQWYLAATGQEDRPWQVDVIAVELSAAGGLIGIERFRDAVSGVGNDGW